MNYPGLQLQRQQQFIFLKSHNIDVIDLNDSACIEMMSKFIRENPTLWNEDIGMKNESRGTGRFSDQSAYDARMTESGALEYAPPDPQPPKGAIGIIFLIVLMDLFGFGVIIPLLPFYAKKFAASDLEVGLLFSIFSACQLIATPILGLMSDRFGRRPVLVLSQLGSVAGYLAARLCHRGQLGEPGGRTRAGLPLTRDRRHQWWKYFHGAGLHRRRDDQRKTARRRWENSARHSESVSHSARFSAACSAATTWPIPHLPPHCSA